MCAYYSDRKKNKDYIKKRKRKNNNDNKIMVTGICPIYAL